MIKTRAEKRIVRKRRVRAKISGTESRPRLSVFKSNKAIYAQIINDDKGTTIVSFDSRKAKSITPKEKAKEVGIEIAKLAISKDITAVVFDRSGYLYTGVIKTLADGAREGGLKF